MQNVPFTSVPVNTDDLPASPSTSKPLVDVDLTGKPLGYRNLTPVVPPVVTHQITTGGANLPMYIVVHPNACYAIGPFGCPTRAMQAAQSQGVDWRYVPILPPGIST